MKSNKLKFFQLRMDVAKAAKQHEGFKREVKEYRRHLVFVREIHGYDSKEYNAAIKKLASMEQKLEESKRLINLYKKMLKKAGELGAQK